MSKTKVSKQSVKAAFGNAASSYNEAAVVQSEILARLLDRLKLLQLDSVARLLDLGSGTGLASDQLRRLHGDESYYAIDFAHPMLDWANSHSTVTKQNSVCGDVEVLPFKENSFEVIFSASTLQWCNDIDSVFNECHRAIQEQGLFLFSTFGPDTLKELRHCFTQIDSSPHVTTFVDMHDLGDGLLSAGFESPVMESEIITVEYSDPMQLLRDLQATGATNHIEQRERGLMSYHRLNAVINEYKKLVLPNRKYPASYEVIYGHGRKQSKVDFRGSAVDQWQPIQFK